ncbi:hypothetical protein LQW54_009359 [Pestalotiopsis sp. IQ-011]
MKFTTAAALSGLFAGAMADLFTLNYNEDTGYCNVVINDICGCSETVQFYNKGTCRSREAGWTRAVPNDSDACDGAKIKVTDATDGFHVDFVSWDNLCEIGCTTAGKLSGNGC